MKGTALKQDKRKQPPASAPPPPRRPGVAARELRLLRLLGLFLGGVLFAAGAGRLLFDLEALRGLDAPGGLDALRGQALPGTRGRLIVDLLFLLVGLLAAAAMALWALAERRRMVRFRSAAGFYTLEHPAAWRVHVEGNRVRLRPADGSCELTLSAHYSPKGVADDFLRELMQKSLPPARTLEPFRRITDRTWLGSQAELEEADPRDGRRRRWLARTCALGSVGVFATVSAAPEAMAHKRRLIERVLDSIELHPPVEVKRPRASA